MMVAIWGRILFLRSGSDIRLPTCYSLPTLGSLENSKFKEMGSL